MRLRPRLDALNFFLADVRGGLGPYVGVFLLTEANWNAAEIGAVLTVSGLIGISFHAPVGALIDATRAKRALIIIAVLLLAACAIAIERRPTGAVVLTADIVMAILGAIFAPTVAAITLGLVRPATLTYHIGRNAVFDRIGNLFIAGLAGAAGWWLGQRIVFWLVPLFAFPTMIAVLSIPAAAIDHRQARGLSNVNDPPAPTSWRDFLIGHPEFLLFCLVVALFHFANASLMPLVGQKLALAHPGAEATYVAACILVAQLSAIPAAMLAARYGDQIGTWPLVVVACLALPLRGLIFALADDPLILVSAQVLDGLCIGVFDTMVPVVVAQMMQGTGRINVSRGILGTVQGVGGSLSNVASGAIVVAFGYQAGFAFLATVALVALALATVVAQRAPKAA